ncbi:hypothetical protein BGZ99_006155 [Dissophora globulifera]|uniref:Uncharacterized protein n=1 Tax=Dissophora globulifera TaxID=979702 RepID=A0A9P6URJ6_9FUNG|nr:hypothetical protein BGZ99_006155 [Dissophora globulifera]
MDPTQQSAGQNGPVAPQPASGYGLDVAPPRADDSPKPQIPGQARLDEAVGKAIGGTVIPSDIRPVDMPTVAKLETTLAAANTNGGPSSPTAPAAKKVATPRPSTQLEKAPVLATPRPSTQLEKAPALATPRPSTQLEKAPALNKDGTTSKSNIVHDLKKRIPGAFPEVTRIGWIEAYKRTDGPSNEFRDKSIWLDDFASSALYGAFWQNAAAVIIIPIVSYVVFKLGGGFVSLILIIAFGGKDKQNDMDLV